MFHLAVFVVAFVAVTAEQVPCGSGAIACAQRTQTATWGDTEFCCGDEFGMHLSSYVVNGTQRTNCECNRIYTDTECLEGIALCRGATSIMAVGGVVKCCKDGQAMTSFHNSLVNGVIVDSCKCKAGNAGNAGNNGNSVVSSSALHMSQSQNSQPAKTFEPAFQMFHANFHHGFNTMFNGMHHMMNQMNNMMFPRMGMGMGMFPGLAGSRRDKRIPSRRYSPNSPTNGLLGLLDRPGFQPPSAVARMKMKAPGFPTPIGVESAPVPRGFNQQSGLDRTVTPAPMPSLLP